MDTQTPARTALLRGASMREMSAVSGRSRSTLDNWHKSSPKMFNAIIDSVLYNRIKARHEAVTIAGSADNGQA